MLIILIYLLIYSGGADQTWKILNVPIYNVLSKDTVAKLTQVWSNNQNPSGVMVKQLAIKMGVKELQVYNWFRNKRAQNKKKAIKTSLGRKPNELSQH